MSKTIHDLARLSYLQNLFIHRRVLVVGDDPALTNFLVGARARYVCSVSENEQSPATQEAADTQPPDHRVMPLDDLSFREGMFDLAIVPDLTAIPNPLSLITELRRVVTKRGRVIVAAPNPTCEDRIGPAPENETIDYYGLYDLLSEAFESVQMVGQAPFLGYAISDLASTDENVGISFDAGLLGDATEEIEWFLAVCGDTPAELEPFSVIQLPLSCASLGGVSEEEMALLQNELRQTKLEVGTRGVKIESLQKDLEFEKGEAEAARERAVKIAKQFDDERKASQAKRIEQEMARRGADIDLQSKLAALTVEFKQSQARAVSAEAGRDELINKTRSDAAEIERLHTAVENREKQFQTQLTKVNDQLQVALRRVADAEAAQDLKDQLEKAALREQELKEELDQAKRKVDEITARVEEVHTSSKVDAEYLTAENRRLEAGLKEIGDTLLAAEKELDRKEVIVRDLLVELESKSTCEGIIEELRRAVEEAESRHEHLIRELEEANDTAQTSTSQLEVFATKAEEGDRRIVQLEGDLKAATWKAEELEARLEDGKRDLAHISTLADTRQRQVDKLRENLDALSAELSASVGASSSQNKARVEAELALATAEAKLLQTEQELTAFIEKTRALEDQLSAAMGTLSGHRRARVEAELAAATAEKIGEDAQSEIARLAQMVADLEAELAAAQGTSRGHQRSRIEAENSLAEAQESAKAIQDSLSDTLVKMTQMEAELAAQQGAHRGHQAARMEAELALKTAESLAARFDAELGDVKKQREESAAALEKAKAESAAVLGLATSETASLRALLEEAEQTLVERRERIRILESDLTSITGQVNDLAGADQQVADLRGQLTKERERVTEAEKRLASTGRNTERVEAELSQTLGRVQKLQTDLEAAAQHTGDLKKDVDTLNRDKASLEDQLNAFQQELTSTKEALHTTKASESHAIEEAINLTEALEFTRTELAGAQAQADRMAKQVEDLDSRIRQELAQENSSQEELQQRVEALQIERDELRLQLERKGSGADGLANRITQLQEELALEANRTRQAGSDAARMAGDAADLTEKLKQRDDLLQETVAQRNAESRTLAILRDEVQALSNTVSRMKIEKRQLAQTDDTADAQLQEAISRASGALEAQRAAEEQAEAVAVRLAALESAMREQSSAATQTIGDLTAELNNLKTSLDVRHSQMEDSAGELSALKRSAEAYQQQIDELHALMDQAEAEADSRLENFQEKLEEANGALVQSKELQHRLQADLTQVNEAQDALRMEFTRANAQLEEELTRANARLEEERARANTQLEAARAQANARLEEELAQANARLEEELAQASIKLEEELAKRDAMQRSQVPPPPPKPSIAPNAAMASELAQLKLTAARQADRITELTEEANERGPLLESVTAQLEEREKRTTMLEKKMRQLEAQLKEHASDTAAWDMELKFRNSRISQLEEELASLNETLSNR